MSTLREFAERRRRARASRQFQHAVDHTDRVLRGEPAPAPAAHVAGAQQAVAKLAAEAKDKTEAAGKVAVTQSRPLWVPTLLAGSVAGVLIITAMGLPGLGHGLQIAPLLLGLALVGSCSASMMELWRQHQLTTRGLGTYAVMTVMLTVLGIVGASTSLVIDGKVVSATSEEARAAAFADEILTVLEQLHSYDDVIGSDEQTARGRIRLIDEAADELRTVEARMAQWRVTDLSRQAVIDTVAAAAHWGAQAAEHRAALLRTPDASLQASFTASRTSYIEQSRRAAELLVAYAGSYGFSLGPDAGGTVE